MIEYYLENKQMYFVFAIWAAIGIFGGPLIYLVLPFTLLLLRRQEMYEEMLIGYLFILILSDSQAPALYFAKNIKNVYIVLLSLFVLFDTSKFQPFNQLYRIFIPFFLMAILTTSLSVQESFFFTSLQKTSSYILSFLVVPNLVLKVFREEGREEFLRRFAFFTFSILLLGLVFRFVYPDIVILKGERFRGLFGGPNGLGMVCVLLFIIYFITNSFYPDLFSKREKQLLFGIIILSLYMCGSRNALISVLLFYTFQRFFGFSPFLGFIIFLITLVLADVVSSYAAELITSLGLGEYFRVQTIEEGSGRYIAWNFAWHQIQNNFFIGKGFAYNEFYMRRHYGELLKLNHQGGIHNSFLTFWMDQGLIGLLIYLYSYVLMFIKAAKNTRFAFPIMFAISFSAFFESWLVGSLSPFAFLGMFIFAIITSNEIIPAIVSEPEGPVEHLPAAVLN